MKVENVNFKIFIVIIITLLFLESTPRNMMYAASNTIEINNSNKITTKSNYVKVLTVQPKANPLLASNGSNYKENNVEDLVSKSNLILKADVLKTEEKAFIEYKNGKVNRTIYKKVITIKPVAIYKMNKNNKSIKLGSVIDILSDCASYNKQQEIIPVKANNQYIFFLEPVKNDGLIQYTSYSKFNIYKSTWSSILFQDNFYTFTNYFSQFTLLDDTQVIEKKDSPYGNVVYKNQNIEKPLVAYIRSQPPFLLVKSNIKEGTGYLCSNKIDNICVGDDKYLTDPFKNKILDYLNNVYTISIEDNGHAIACAPTGGVPLSVEIEFKDNNIIKTEIIGLTNAQYMTDIAYDRYNNIVFRRCYFCKPNAGYGLQALCNELNSSKNYLIALNINNIDNESVEAITVSNYIQRQKRFTDKQGIENCLNILKSINATPTSETIKNSLTMEMSIIYKSNNNIHKENFYFTDNLMLYKVYDSAGNLMSSGFYKTEKDILGDIEDLAMPNK